MAAYLSGTRLVCGLPLALAQFQGTVQVAVAHLVIMQHQQQLLLWRPRLVLLHSSQQRQRHQRQQSTHYRTPHFTSGCCCQCIGVVATLQLQHEQRRQRLQEHYNCACSLLWSSALQAPHQ